SGWKHRLASGHQLAYHYLWYGRVGNPPTRHVTPEWKFGSPLMLEEPTQPWRLSDYAASRMVMENDPSVKVLPEVTACEADSSPVASSTEPESSVSAQCVAVPVVLMTPSEMADTTTRRPSVAPFCGALTVGVALVPSR